MLQTGRVVKLENDPAGEYRILIQVPVRTGKEIWARMASFDAGNKRGAAFLPEIGDEVIVGFINGDNALPVVLGMLYGKDRPPVFTPKDTNHHKAYTSRNNMQIHFDDEARLIEIRTPAGNQIILDEKNNKIEIIDKQSNTIRMSASGIQVKSTNEITIEAAAQLNIRSSAKISIEGSEIELKARGSLRMNATNITSAATGNSEIKASLVKIN